MNKHLPVIIVFSWMNSLNEGILKGKIVLLISPRFHFKS